MPEGQDDDHDQRRQLDALDQLAPVGMLQPAHAGPDHAVEGYGRFAVVGGQGEVPGGHPGDHLPAGEGGHREGPGGVDPAWTNLDERQATMPPIISATDVTSVRSRLRLQTRPKYPAGSSPQPACRPKERAHWPENKPARPGATTLTTTSVTGTSRGLARRHEPGQEGEPDALGPQRRVEGDAEAGASQVPGSRSQPVVGLAVVPGAVEDIEARRDPGRVDVVTAQEGEERDVAVGHHTQAEQHGIREPGRVQGRGQGRDRSSSGNFTVASITTLGRSWPTRPGPALRRR
jgi:hypothetical protein